MSLVRKTASFLSFLYVCPEPVLAKGSFLYINGSKIPFFAAISVLVSLVLWGSIWGLQGAVLSVPLLAAMKVALVRTQARNLPRGA
jgi:hypothetical protein